jgi:hypothetical protein
MSVNGRGVQEGTQYQGPGEKITWIVVPEGDVVSISGVVVTDATEVVTAAVMPTGAASAASDIITLAPLLNLVLHHTYKISIHYSDGLNILEIAFDVVCS